MRRMLLPFVVVIALVPASLHGGGTKKAEAIKETLKKLQGVWQMVKMESGGEVSGNTDSLSILFDGDSYHFLVNGERDPNPAKIFLDPSKNPMTIDLVLRGVGVAGTHLGILRFTQDGLEICMNPPRGAGSDKRPSAFTTKAELGAGGALYVLERRATPGADGQKKEPKVSGDGKVSKKAAIAADLKKLQGKWNMVKSEVNGMNRGRVEGLGILIEGDTYYFVNQGVKDENSAKLFLDPTSDPKAVDFVLKGVGIGGTKLAIYRFTDDGLEICWNQPRGAGSDKRPRAFTTKAEVGAGSVLWTLERPAQAIAGEKKQSAKSPGGVQLSKKDAISADLKKLQGSWNMVKTESDGRPIGFVEGKSILFEDDTYYFVVNGVKQPNSAKVFLDPTKDPATIDLVLKGVGIGGTQLGVYRFTDDGLEICLNQARGPGSEKRPSAFTTKAELGAGSILFVLERPAGASTAEGKTDQKSTDDVKLAKKEAAKAELQKLQGVWNMVKMESDGLPDGFVEGKSILFDGDRYYFVSNGAKQFPAKVFLDPTKEPKAIDLQGNDGTMLGVYRFTEDGLEICVNQARGAGSNKRPSAFTTKAQVGAGSILYVLVRPAGTAAPETKKGVKGPVDAKSKKAAIQAELKKLQGTWNTVKSEVNGRPFGGVVSRSILIDDDAFYFVVDGRKEPFGSKIFLDPTVEPKEIDLVPKLGSGGQLGIYRFTDGGLEICLNQPQGAGSDKRPQAFTTKAEVGAGSILHVLERPSGATNNDKNKDEKVAAGAKLPKKAAIEADLKKLQGNWRMVKMEFDGMQTGNVDGKGVLFEGDNYSFVVRGVKQIGKKIFLDPTQEPNTIDLISAAGNQLGIYRFTEDGLEICLNQAQGPGSDKRPKAFTTKAEVGAGSILYVLERPTGATKSETKKGQTVPAGAKTPKKQAVEADLKKLQGNWRIVKMEVDGKLKGNVEGDGIFIEGNTQWSIIRGEKRKAGTKKIFLDPTQAPSTIDLVSSSGSQLGVYRFTDDGLEICLNQAEVDKRPKAFTTKTELGAGSILYVLQRPESAAVTPTKKSAKTAGDSKAKNDAIQAELKKLQGTWTIVKTEIKGKPIREAAPRSMLFEGDTYTFVVKGVKQPRPSRFLLDPTKEPKAIDVVASKGDRPRLGVYRFTDDGLEICLNQSGGLQSDRRPEVFSTQEGEAGAGGVLYILKRPTE